MKDFFTALELIRLRNELSTKYEYDNLGEQGHICYNCGSTANRDTGKCDNNCPPTELIYGSHGDSWVVFLVDRGEKIPAKATNSWVLGMENPLSSSRLPLSELAANWERHIWVSEGSPGAPWIQHPGGAKMLVFWRVRP